MAIMKYEHPLSDVELLENYIADSNRLVRLCISAIKIKSSREYSEFVSYSKDAHENYLKICEKKEQLPLIHKKLKKETPLTSELLKSVDIVFDELKFQMLLVEKIYILLSEKTQNYKIYKLHQYWSDIRKLRKSDKARQKAGSYVSYVWNILIQDIEQPQKQSSEELLKEKETTVNELIYKISEILGGPEKDNLSFDKIFNSANFNYGKRLGAEKALLSIILGDVKYTKQIREFNLSDDEYTLNRLDEMISFFQASNIGWHEGKFIPVKAMLVPEILEYMLLNTDSLISANSDEEFLSTTKSLYSILQKYGLALFPEQDNSLQNKVYKVSVMLCNPKNEKSIDIFYSRFDSDFNWDKRCLAIKSLLDIIDESEELEPLLEEFDLGCDEDTLSLFEEIMSFLQGLGLDWQNDKYIPVEVMLNYKALSFILENDLVRLPELSSNVFPIVLLDFMSLLRSENILGTNDLYTTK